MSAEAAVRVEDKLYLQPLSRRCRPRPHQGASAHDAVAGTAQSAERLSGALLRTQRHGQVEITIDGCVECGTCRIIGEPSGDIEWNYPRGGYGVLFKFG